MRFSQAYPGAAAIFVDEFDAGQLKCPSQHSDRLRLHAKPKFYRFFLGAFVAWPRTAFAAGLDAAAASAERTAAALVRRTPG
jgi:hypothetical protein